MTPNNFRNMKKIISVLLLIAAICTGCTTRYSLILTNGDVITSMGKPKFDEQKGYYLYKDADGQTNIVFASKVREVAPSSMADKGGTQFLK